MDFTTLAIDEFSSLGLNAFTTLPTNPARRSRSVISGERYLVIAHAYAGAYEAQLGFVEHVASAVESLLCLDDETVVADLLPTFYDVYSWMQRRSPQTATFSDSVRRLQHHVQERTGMPVANWIAAEVDGGVIPFWWAVLSKAVGYDIDSVIDPDTIPSGS